MAWEVLLGGLCALGAKILPCLSFVASPPFLCVRPKIVSEILALIAQDFIGKGLIRRRWQPFPPNIPFTHQDPCHRLPPE